MHKMMKTSFASAPNERQKDHSNPGVAVKCRQHSQIGAPHSCNPGQQARKTRTATKSDEAKTRASSTSNEAPSSHRLGQRSRTSSASSMAGLRQLALLDHNSDPRLLQSVSEAWQSPGLNEFAREASCGNGSGGAIFNTVAWC